MSVLTPTGGIDPRIALATSVYAARGVYSLLLGSGISTEAGVPTGWAILLDLVRMIARAGGVDLVDTSDEATERWFVDHYGVDPRYDDLLARLAGTDLARRDLLRRYFDRAPADGGPYQPTEAHRVIATMCATGRIRVILTTNFDDLLERALAEAAVIAQIIVSGDDIRGMTPLQHAQTTLIKLHGDYRGTMMNTADELGTYPAGLHQLVAEVLDRYGLIVAGWSAQWDMALCSEVKGSTNRRYPVYWLTYRGHTTKIAREVIDFRQATVIDSRGASEFFTDLGERLERLENSVRRRTQSPLLWHHRESPRDHLIDGWQVTPLLWMRTVAIVPAILDACAPITPIERTALVRALNASDLTACLNALGRREGRSAAAVQDPPTVPGLDSLAPWEVTPDGRQSDKQASYRLGDETTSGVSCLVRVQLPDLGHGGSVMFTVDAGISLSEPLTLRDAAEMWINSLVACVILLPTAVMAVLPAGGLVTDAEIHAYASGTDGNQRRRPNRLEGRIELDTLGRATKEVSDSIGVAMRIVQPFTAADARRLVISGIERMALNQGLLDPGAAISALTKEFGVSGTGSESLGVQQ